MIIFSDMMNLFGKYWKPSDQIKKEIRDALKEFGKLKCKIKYRIIFNSFNYFLFLKILKETK